MTQGCLRGVPGSHRWGILKHEESDDPRSILARGHRALRSNGDDGSP